MIITVATIFLQMIQHQKNLNLNGNMKMKIGKTINQCWFQKYWPWILDIPKKNYTILIAKKDVWIWNQIWISGNKFMLGLEKWSIQKARLVKINKGPSINDITHFLRFLTPLSPLSPILLNRLMESNITFWQIPLPT